MTLILALWGATLLSATQCTEVREDLPLQASLAPKYLEIAEQERAAGNLDAAEIAYREALRRDGSLQGAIFGLRQICEDYPQFMLDGIDLFTANKNDQADHLFAKASRDSALMDAAEIYRAMIVRKQSRGADAQAWFDPAYPAQDHRARAAVQGLVKDLGRQRKYAAAISLLAGIDTRAALLPDETPFRAPTFDGVAAPSIAASFFPWGENLPGARLSGAYSKLFRQSDVDLLQAGVTLAWAPRFEDWLPRFEVAEEFRLQGYDPYLWNTQGRAALRKLFGETWAELSYSAGSASFRSGPARAYSGFQQAAALEGSVPLGTNVWLQAGYGLNRLRGAGLPTSYFEHGPNVLLRGVFGTSLVLELDSVAGFRGYDARAPTDVVVRSQFQLDSGIRAEWLLGGPWSLLGAFNFVKTFSNVPVADASRFFGTVGVSYVLHGK